MAKDRELQDHERAHTGVAGSKVDHGHHPTVSSQGPFDNAAVLGHLDRIKTRSSDYGYRRVHAAANQEGTTISQRQVRKYMKIGKEYQDD